VPRGATDLGVQDINGIQAQGYRTSSSAPPPPGTQVDGGKVVTTIETWTSIDLGLVVKQVRVDPLSGVTTFQIKNLSRLEPDATLFLPPIGYSLVQETGDITIAYAGP
jgi:hypothetical protein